MTPYHDTECMLARYVMDAEFPGYRAANFRKVLNLQLLEVLH